MSHSTLLSGFPPLAGDLLASFWRHRSKAASALLLLHRILLDLTLLSPYVTRGDTTVQQLLNQTTESARYQSSSCQA